MILFAAWLHSANMFSGDHIFVGCFHQEEGWSSSLASLCGVYVFTRLFGHSAWIPSRRLPVWCECVRDVWCPVMDW